MRDHWGQLPNRKVREGDRAPISPKEKRQTRRQQRHSDRTFIHQFIGAQIMPADEDYFDIDEEE